MHNINQSIKYLKLKKVDFKTNKYNKIKQKIFFLDQTVISQLMPTNILLIQIPKKVDKLSAILKCNASCKTKWLRISLNSLQCVMMVIIDWFIDWLIDNYFPSSSLRCPVWTVMCPVCLVDPPGTYRTSSPSRYTSFTGCIISWKAFVCFFRIYSQN